MLVVAGWDILFEIQKFETYRFCVVFGIALGSMRNNLGNFVLRYPDPGEW